MPLAVSFKDAARRVDRHAVAVSAAFEFAELALILDRAVGLHIVGHDDRTVGDVERLLIRD